MTTPRRVGCLLLAALSTMACGNHLQVFTKTSVKSTDAMFLVAAQFAQYEPLRPTELAFELREDSKVTINFNAMGSTRPVDLVSSLMPPLMVQCRMDGNPCAPGYNDSTVQFKFPPERAQVLCCDTRGFTWVAPVVAKGSHSVLMWGQMRNPELASVVQIGEWSLVIQAFGQ